MRVPSPAASTIAKQVRFAIGKRALPDSANVFNDLIRAEDADGGQDDAEPGFKEQPQDLAHAAPNPTPAGLGRRDRDRFWRGRRDQPDRYRQRAPGTGRRLSQRAGARRRTTAAARVGGGSGEPAAERRSARA